MRTERTEVQAEIVARAIKGDPAAWATLVETYAPLTWSVCRGCGLSQTDAEDVSQTVFTALLRRLPFIEDPNRLSGWIIVSAKREAWRVSALNRRTGGDGSDTQDKSIVEPNSDELERQHAVRQSLEHLDVRCRNLLLEAFGTMSTPTYESLAESLNLKENSVGPTKRRCLDALLQDLLECSGDLFLP